MKKIEYKAPKMEIINLKFQGILCGSPTEGEQPEQGGGGGGIPMD